MPREAHQFGPDRCYPASSPGRSPVPTDCCQRGGCHVPAIQYPLVSTCRPASLLLISGAVQLVFPSSAKIQPARSTLLHHNHLLLDHVATDPTSCGFLTCCFGLLYVLSSKAHLCCSVTRQRRCYVSGLSKGPHLQLSPQLASHP